MGNQTYHIDDLVYCSSIRKHGGYGKILSIVDRQTGELYDEKTIITGWGDKNTQVDILIRIIADQDNKNGIYFDTNRGIKYCPERIDTFDPHDVYIVDLGDIIKRHNKTIKKMNESLDFLKKHSLTRDEKLELILKD